jgi:hypothetical protein
MAITLATVQGAVGEASARAEALQRGARLDAVEATYDTLLLVLGTLLAAETESPRGWQRPAVLLCAVRHRLVMDALASSRLTGLQIRAATLLDLPEVLVLGSLAEIQDALRAAITVGAPRYNAGNVRGCCTVYWATAQTLLAATAIRGFSGYARAMALLRAASESAIPGAALDEQGVDDLAWALRRAFDDTLRLSG